MARRGKMRPVGRYLNSWQLLHESDFEDTDTKLLLHLDNEVTDWAKGATVTNTNVTFSSTVWKFNTHSAYFNGTSAQLNIPDSSDWDFGTGNFTIDFRVRFDSITTNNNQYLWIQWVDSDNRIQLHFNDVTGEDNFLQLYAISGGVQAAFVRSNPWVPSVDTWYHVAVVRNGSNINIYVDGTALGLQSHTVGTTMPNIAANPEIGRYALNLGRFKGYLDEYRVVKGTAKWTSNFTPPTAPYLGRTTTYPITKDRNTVLMISGEGANNSTTVIDECGKAVTCNGNAQIDTAQYKFGQSSILFDGTGDYLSLADSADWYFGTQDFTIDFWVRFNDITGQQIFVMSQIDANNAWYCGKTAANVMFFAADVGGVTKASYQSAVWSCVNNTWYHIVWERSGSSMKLFIGGASQSLTETTAIGTNDIGAAGTLYIGRYGINNLYYLNGWLDDIRISKGIARWTSAFTPPLKTTALINGDTDEEYRLISENVNGANASILLRLNNDSAANYGYQQVHGSNATIDAFRNSDTSWYLNYGILNDVALSERIIYAKSGYIRTSIISSGYNTAGTTVGAVLSMGNVWNNTTAPIANLNIFADAANGLGCGTKFLLYRKVKP